MQIEERVSTHIYRQKQMFTKEELEAREHLCVHEQPAYCNAACPLKLDTKALVAAVARGNFEQALGLYEKITPFPHILSALCEAPCESACKLCSLGEGISIRELEAAVLHWGSRSRGKSFLRKKPARVAVFGSSLFTLFLAGELAKKRYPVTVFCAQETPRDFLAACAPALSEQVRDAALADLHQLEIAFVWGCDPKEALRAQGSAFDLTAAEYALANRLFPDLEADEGVMVSRKYHLLTGPTQGVLGAAFGAKRAALSADRMAQKLDPANTRGEEGPMETRLYTSLEGITGSRRIPVADRGSAMAEAARCIQCRCEECIKGCAYLQHYQKFPRILTREIYNNVSIIMGDHMMNKPINACSLCGQCSFTCPNGYDMGEICHKARQNMVFTGKMPLAPHEFALQDMLFSNEEAFLCRPQPGFDRCRYVFFPGCQASAIAPATVRAAYRDLCARLDGGVGLVLGCCGIISDWAGRYELYEQTVEFLHQQLEALGSPAVIAGCPTCKKSLSSHLSQEVIGIWEILETIGLPERPLPAPRPMALHDACGARGDDATQQSIRRIAQALGYQLADIPYSEDLSPCCGYGGLTQYANREVAAEMTDKCLERSDLPCLSYCMACRDRFARQGRESVHILELVYGTAADQCPDISAKRYNRLGLKQQLLEEIWKEKQDAMELEFTLTYAPGTEAQMDDRMILKSDVIAVLRHLRETGEAVLDADTGLCVTRARLGNVTFWVKYREIPGGYQVFGAYSHRMNIVTRQ